MREGLGSELPVRKRNSSTSSKTACETGAVARCWRKTGPTLHECLTAGQGDGQSRSSIASDHVFLIPPIQFWSQMRAVYWAVVSFFFFSAKPMGRCFSYFILSCFCYSTYDSKISVTMYMLFPRMRTIFEKKEALNN